MSDPWQRLRHLPDTDISLLSAALLIAKDEYPELALADYEARVDAYARRLQPAFDASRDDTARLSLLNEFLYEELGFAGDEGDYYHPRNSYLNEVLDRRLGNPISLAVIQLALAQRLGLPLEGVSFPGHFLLRLALEDDGMVVLDPFHRGRTLDLPELRRRARHELAARDVDDQRLARLLEPASHRAIVLRMLRNLKVGYQSREAWDKALRCTDRIVTLDRLAVDEFRDRGMLYLRLGHRRAARDDLKRYLALSPQAEDRDAIRDHIMEAAQGVDALH